MLKVEYVSPDGLLIDRFEMADGMTLDKAARTICPDSEGKFPLPVIAIVGDKPAVKSLGDWDIPLQASTVQFRQLAMGGGGGGGSNPLQMVFQVVIVALATLATWYLGGIGGPLVAAGMSTAMAGFTAAMAGAAIMLLGTLLMGVLFPNKTPQGQAGAMSAEQASPTYSINASGNQARLYQCEPELLGRMKITPDFVANTWTEYIDNGQIGYFVYGIGRGEYEIESLQFGETVFWKNGKVLKDAGYEIVGLEFVRPGKPVTLFPDNVITSSEVNGQELFAPNNEEYEGAIGPYVTNAPGTVTNKLLLDFVFQSGLGAYSEEGNFHSFTVNWLIEYPQVDDFGMPVSEWATLEKASLTMATLTPQRLTKKYDVANGRYQVRVRRTSNSNGDGRCIDTLTWYAMRAILPGTLTYPISCVAIAIEANNSLTQSASRQFSIIATRKLPLYDYKTKTWSKPVVTRSFAAAVSHVCKCEWGGNLADANIDLESLWRIEEKINKRGWHYDAYIDGPYLVWTLINEMCQSQCVIPRLVGPVLSFILDEADRPPTFALNARNIIRNSFSVQYHTWSDETPDDVCVEYLDADFGFQKRDVMATLPESESREPTNMDILGITNREHAFKIAVAYAAHNRWQRISVECQVEALGRIINRGDICTVAHPRFKNTCAGAVEDWQENTLTLCLIQDFGMRGYGKGRFYYEKIQNQKWPKIITGLENYGIRTGIGKGAFFNEDSLSITVNESSSQTGNYSASGQDYYLALTRADGSIWGPCKLAFFNSRKAVFDSADYATLLLQGAGNPFEWLSRGIRQMPTSWTLYTGSVYQRLMVVDSIQSQDFLRYNLKLLNYDKRIYEYDWLATPLWGGRGQFSDTGIFRAPKNLNGFSGDKINLTISWLNVPGALGYEVEIASGGSDWESLGKVGVCQLTCKVVPGPVKARVRAIGQDRYSEWSEWSGDTTIMPPFMPQNLRLNGDYEGAKASIAWDEVAGATKYIVTLKNSKDEPFYTKEQTDTTFKITPEIQEGGPYRKLIVCIVACNGQLFSDEASLELNDPAPLTPKLNLYRDYQTDRLQINGISHSDDADITGALIAYSAYQNFGVDKASGLVGINLNNLPFYLESSKDRLFFRVAVRDRFYEITKNPMDLNWTTSSYI